LWRERKVIQPIEAEAGVFKSEFACLDVKTCQISIAFTPLSRISHQKILRLNIHLRLLPQHPILPSQKTDHGLILPLLTFLQLMPIRFHHHPLKTKVSALTMAWQLRELGEILTEKNAGYIQNVLGL